ncbi:MAG: hypothetical protein AAGJ81_05085 [Verrucomicrobiota bacterium]
MTGYNKIGSDINIEPIKNFISTFTIRKNIPINREKNKENPKATIPLLENVRKQIETEITNRHKERSLRFPRKV